MLEIAGTTQPAALLYCLDSHDYSTIPSIDGYGWFTQDQIRWYRDRSAAYTAANGGKPLPALAFFHIALPEYVAAWRNPGNTHIGRAAEDECPGELNPGMFAAMVESGDVMGVFVGHDHDIDYVVAEKGIALGYGRFSGDDTTYNNLRPGVRILVLTTSDVSYHNELMSAAINQSKYQLYLNVKMDLDILVPWEHQTETVGTNVLLAETVIVGKVPQTYVEVE